MNAIMTMLLAMQVSGIGLAGDWKKDPARSDDPREKMQSAFQQMRREGGHGGGGMHGGGMHGGGPGPGWGGGGGQRGEGRGRGSMALSAAPDELTLALEGTELTVSGGDVIKVYALDGKKHETEGPDGNKMETTAELVGNAVSIKETMSRGKVDRKYEVSPDGETLIVTATMELGAMKEPVVIKSVYVRPPKEG